MIRQYKSKKTTLAYKTTSINTKIDHLSAYTPYNPFNLSEMSSGKKLIERRRRLAQKAADEEERRRRLGVEGYKDIVNQRQTLGRKILV